jgi:hypothetical protein
MIIASILYLIALGVTTYDKYCSVLDSFEKPGLYRHPMQFALFFIAKLLLWSISCILFYRVAGLWAGLTAAVFYLAYGTVLLRVLARRRIIKVWFPVCVRIVRDERLRDGQPPLSEAEATRKALTLAEIAVRKAIKNET